MRIDSIRRANAVNMAKFLHFAAFAFIAAFNNPVLLWQNGISILYKQNVDKIYFE